MKVYVTKYVGEIITFDENEHRVKIDIGEESNYVYITAKYYSNGFTLGKNCFYDHAEAIEAAEKVKQKKIDSLKKQIEKLDKMAVKTVNFRQ